MTDTTTQQERDITMVRDQLFPSIYALQAFERLVATLPQRDDPVAEGGYMEPEAVATLTAEGWVLDGDQWVLPALQPVSEGKVATVEAVATIVRTEDGLDIDWLVEGGIASMVEGETLLICGERLTDETGSGEVYTTPPSPSLRDSRKEGDELAHREGKNP